MPRWATREDGEKPTPPISSSAHIAGPGCQAADASLLVLGYLTQLAGGKGSFGVLGIGKVRLEEGAVAASRLGETQIAQAMSTAAQELPSIHTPEAASRMMPVLQKLVDQTWELGRRCGGSTQAMRSRLAEAHKEARHIS